MNLAFLILLTTLKYGLLTGLDFFTSSLICERKKKRYVLRTELYAKRLGAAQVSSGSHHRALPPVLVTEAGKRGAGFVSRARNEQ